MEHKTNTNTQNWIMNRSYVSKRTCDSELFSHTQDFYAELRSHELGWAKTIIFVKNLAEGIFNNVETFEDIDFLLGTISDQVRENLQEKLIFMLSMHDQMSLWWNSLKNIERIIWQNLWRCEQRVFWEHSNIFSQIVWKIFSTDFSVHTFIHIFYRNGRFI